MNTKTLLASALAIFSLTACSPSSEEAKEDTYEPTFQIQDCDVKLGGIHFTKMINGADKQVSQTDTIIRFIAPEGTDLFIDPNDGKLTKSTAKILLTAIDNTTPFTFSGRLTPGFTEDGLYNAANLMVVANDTLWQKFCF